MKKIFIVLLSALLLVLTGCQAEENRKIEEEKYESYLNYYQMILDSDDKQLEVQNFNIELVVNKLDDGKYRYDVIIDEPKVAMFHIKVLAVEDELSSTLNKEVMMPSIGIMDDVDYSLVPGQINKEAGYVEGVILSLVSNEPSLRVGVMVEYTDSSMSNSVRLFISLYNDYNEV